MTKTRTDPIIAMIAEYTKLDRQASNAYSKLTVAEGALDAAGNRQPFSLIAWRDYSAIGGCELERVRDEYLRDRVAPRHVILAEYKDAKVRYQAAVAAEKEWYRQNCPKERDTFDKLQARQLSVRARVVRTVPVNATGIVALCTFLHREMTMGDNDFYPRVVKNIRQAAETIE